MRQLDQFAPMVALCLVGCLAAGCGADPALPDAWQKSDGDVAIERSGDVAGHGPPGPDSSEVGQVDAVEEALAKDPWADDPLLPLRIKIHRQRRVGLPIWGNKVGGGAEVMPGVMPYSLHRHGEDLRLALQYPEWISDSKRPLLLGSVKSASSSVVQVVNLANLPVVMPKKKSVDSPDTRSRIYHVACLTSKDNGNWLVVGKGYSDGEKDLAHLQFLEVAPDGQLVQAVAVKTPPSPPAYVQSLSPKTQARVTVGSPMFLWSSMDEDPCVWHAESQAFILRDVLFGPWSALRIDANGVGSWRNWTYAPTGLEAGGWLRYVDENDGSSGPILPGEWLPQDPATVWPFTKWSASHFDPAALSFRLSGRVVSLGSSLFELDIWEIQFPFGSAVGRMTDSPGSPTWLVTEWMRHLDPFGETGNYDWHIPEASNSKGFHSTHGGSTVQIGAFGHGKSSTSGSLADMRRTALIARHPETGAVQAALPRSGLPHQGVWMESACVPSPDGMICVAVRAPPCGPPCYGPWCSPDSSPYCWGIWNANPTAKFPGELVVTEWRTEISGQQ